jgi:hypothetical protein
MWNLGTDSAFALGPRKTTENFDRVGRSQDLPDANRFIGSSPALNTRALTLVPICAFFFFLLFLWKHLQVVFTKIYLHIIWISTKPCITPIEGMNAYRHRYAYNYTYICKCDWRARSKSKSKSLRLTVSQSVCLGIEYPCGTCDRILFPVGMLLSEICGLVSVRRPLWREDGSAICSVITQWSKSLRTRNHTLLSHLRFPQPGGQGSRIYILHEQGGPVIPLGTGLVGPGPYVCPLYNTGTDPI